MLLWLGGAHRTEVFHQIPYLISSKAGPEKPPLADLGFHHRSVVPQGRAKLKGRRNGRRAGEVRGERPFRPAGRVVAEDAALFHVETLAFHHITGRIEILEEEKIGEKIRELVVRKLRQRNLERLHFGPHLRLMVPHKAGDLRDTLV